jgi:hypothetical protein
MYRYRQLGTPWQSVRFLARDDGCCLAFATRMAAITMWRQNDRQCQLVTGLDRHQLRIVEHGHALRDESFDALDVAILAAQLWAEQEVRSVFGLRPPDRRLWL